MTSNILIESIVLLRIDTGENYYSFLSVAVVNCTACVVL